VEHTLTTADGERISALHVAGDHAVAFIVVHGFTGNWREERVLRVVGALAQYGGVVALDMRGHGRSSGRTSMGDVEVHDVQAAVAWARELGYHGVVLVGFSMGGAVALRAAALAERGELPERVDAVVSVSAPAFWYYRGTRMTNLVHSLILNPIGRAVLRAKGVRVTSQEWTQPLPMAPHEAAGALSSVPLLVVHGDVDHYFPLEHPRAIEASARANAVDVTMWIEPGFAHAESSVSADCVARIAEWAVSRVASG
jgi:pimeloyl-ACP methyl ester carboxylesterase